MFRSRACAVLVAALVLVCGVVDARKHGGPSRTLSRGEDLGGVELKQEKMRENLKDGLLVMRKERKAIASSGKKASTRMIV